MVLTNHNTLSIPLTPHPQNRPKDLPPPSVLTLMRTLLLSLILATLAQAAGKERWIYLPANFQVDAEANRVITLLERGAKAGYTHALVTDSKFSRLESVTEAYRPNVARVKGAAKRLKIQLIPCVYPVGYSNDLLFHNPNLAEGLPVKDALYAVHNGIAKIEADPAVTLPGGAMNDRSGWDFIDESIVAKDGHMVSGPTDGNARLSKRVKVSPFRQYRLSVKIKTEDFSGSAAEIKALAGDKSLQLTNLKVEKTQDWTRQDVTFNSLGNTEVGIYFGVWGGHKGSLYWDEALIEETGPVNLLRRPGTPLTIRSEGGELLTEGKEFEKLTDPLMGTKPWSGEYTAWHQPPQIRVKGLKDGEKLRVSYFHAHVIHDGQVCGCVEEPEFQKLLWSQAKQVADLWQAPGHFMSHDEWRVLGWDEACHRGKSPGEIVAENARLCTAHLREITPQGRILVWSDMFDPHHNAVKDYYLVNGSLDGAWEGLPPEVEVMNWNFGKRKESLGFFEKRRHAQLIAGFYDDDIANVAKWLDAAKDTARMKGFMSTTWRNDYSQLEKMAEILEAKGW